MEKFICNECLHPNLSKEKLPQEFIKGKCDYCDKDRDFVAQTDLLYDYFIQILECYEENENGKSIAELLREDWDIFNENMDINKIFDLITNILPEDNKFADATTTTKFAMKNMDVSKFDNIWEDFNLEIRGKNRFFYETDILELLKKISETYSSDINSENVKLYRARTYTDDKLNCENMGMPPVKYARANRGNSVGIPHLYLSSDKKTCVAEIRPNLFENIAIATYKIESKEMNVLDLTNTKLLNPFDIIYNSEDSVTYALIEHKALRPFFDKISKLLSKPVKYNDIGASYAPTQYICEWAKFNGFDGVRYDSAISKCGWNVVLFSEEHVKCEYDLEYVEINTIEYGWE